ncbi:MAG: aldo/keto reductase [Paracoccaceae bacterium]|nr:aldo/keto reductase [Paracoccaceae bacterium]
MEHKISKLHPPRFELSSKLSISRILTGLWQIADIERKSGPIDRNVGADKLQAYFDAGFDTFDMADHYGTAEIVAGTLLKRFSSSTPRPTILTKWCPKPGKMTDDIVRKGISERLTRIQSTSIDLLQFHWWSFQHPAWLDALHHVSALQREGLIKEIGVTNFDTAHLRLALSDGIPIITNQVSFSLLDRRASGSLAKLCSTSSVKLLAYGTLCGGFLTEKWLGKPEPKEISDWSKMKYKRFIDIAGGWKAFQNILAMANKIAKKYRVSIANVATRWVLEQKGVAGVIIGARLGENSHSADNMHLFSFSLDDDDYALFNEAFAKTNSIPGDCGDEYRKSPFLTASGDLSDHLSTIPFSNKIEPILYHSKDARILSGSEWEDVAGYCRANRVGNRIYVAGTTATAGLDRIVAPDDAGAQTTFILDKILEALSQLGAKVEDIVRTRIYIIDEKDVAAVADAHGLVFKEIKPTNTLIVVQKLIGNYRVEIEAEAVIRN